MRNTLRFSAFALMALLAVSFASPDISAQTKRRPVVRKKTVTKRVVTPKFYTVTGGKRLHVRMNETISSKSARIGDRFTATVTDPVYSSNGIVLIPQGSEVVGRVDSVVQAKKGGKPGSIDATFVELRLPNGLTRKINGSLTELDSDDAKSDSEGRASGDKMKHRKVIFIGGGGAGGAILGGVIGGGKGALIGGLLGAGAGLAGERLTKGEEAEVKSGTEFGVYLNQAISLPRYAETSNP